MKTLILNNQQIQQKINRMAYEIYESNYDAEKLVLAGIADRGYTLAKKLKKALNGLPQASARFREHMDKILKSFGCKPTSQHPCVYVLEHEGSKAYIPVFVDDVGLMAKDKKIFQFIKEKLAELEL